MEKSRPPLTLVTGPLGSGKTTLLRHILDTVPGKIAILMNEFGEIGIDAKIVEGKNVRIAELDGGCVCCSLLGEFEAAVEEILDTVRPHLLVVETTGVAEPEALIFDIQESLPRIRLDGVVAVADVDSMLRFPQWGHTTRLQMQAADAILVNKVDLVSSAEVAQAEQSLRALNARAALLRTQRCRVDPDLLFGIAGKRKPRRPQHRHQPEFESFGYRPSGRLQRACFEDFVTRLGEEVYRAKGFVRMEEGSFLFNFVAGRWEFEPFESSESVLVFIGKKVGSHRDRLVEALEKCLARER